MELMDKIKENPNQILKKLEDSRTELEVQIRTKESTIEELSKRIKEDPDINNDILDILDKVKTTNSYEELNMLKDKCNQMEESVLKEIEDLIKGSQYLTNLLNQL